MVVAAVADKVQCLASVHCRWTKRRLRSFHCFSRKYFLICMQCLIHTLHSQAYNTIIRMEPNMRYPFNVRSFFTPDGARQIGGGIELWRGFFQSIRPGPGRLFLNLDIASCMMYRPGTLIELCLDFFERMDLMRNNQFSHFLSPSSAGLPLRERIRLQKFLTGLRVTVPATTQDKKRPIRRISDRPAQDITFEYQGRNITVAHYFQLLGIQIRFPQMFCVEVSACLWWYKSD